MAGLDPAIHAAGQSRTWRSCTNILLGLPAFFLFLSSLALATPYVPSSGSIVLEELPDASDPSARTLKSLHAALAADPRNRGLAVQAARADLALARSLGDPRYLGRAEADLAPWPASPQAPAEIMLLRAVILQSNHDFPASLAALAQVLRAEPRNAQAWLTQAAIHQARAEYDAALADCGQLATTTMGLVPDICTASVMSLTGRAALALRAVGLSLHVNAAEAQRMPAVTVWAMTLAAETASRLNDPSAESWFARARAIDPADPYLLGAWSDYLLDHHRPQEVRTLLANRTRIDPLLLRLAIAEQTLQAPEATGHIADLAARFEASRLRGDTVHRREEARFELVLRHDPAAALALATANWTVQREPADARILREAALAAR